jgi:hypothetical protein
LFSCAGEDIEILKIPLKEIPVKIGNKKIDRDMMVLACLMNQGQVA